MGGKCPHRKVKKRRYSHKTSRRTKFEIKDILSVVFSLFFSLAFSLFLVDFLWTIWLIFLTTSLWITWRCCLWEPSEDRWGEEAVACRWRSSWDGPVLLLALRVNYLVLVYWDIIYIYILSIGLVFVFCFVIGLSFLFFWICFLFFRSLQPILRERGGEGWTFQDETTQETVCTRFCSSIHFVRLKRNWNKWTWNAAASWLGVYSCCT